MSDSGGLVPLPWEQRNLGIPAFRLGDAFIEHADEETLRACLATQARQCEEFFVQARVRFDTSLMRVLAGSGFYLVEATICPLAVLENNGPLRDFVADPGSFLPARYVLADIRTVILDRTDAALGAAVRRIAGESFSDDRFHADHNCDQAVADRRFVYWVDDLTGDPEVAFDVMLLKERPIGFMARKAEDLILAGFARKFVGAGLGDFLWLSVLRKLKDAGLNQARTLISIRNTSVLNLYARLGFKFRDPRVTFHYWKRLDALR